MPGGNKPTKDAVSSDSLGERQSRYDPGVSEWGNPLDVTIQHSYLNT